MKNNKVTIIVAVLVAIATLGLVFKDQIIELYLRPTSSTIPTGMTNIAKGSQVDVAKNLDTPWAIAHLPNGDLLVTERKGTIQRIGENGEQHIVSGVEETSEGGLLGIALHPKFADNRFVYVYLTTLENGSLVNKVERYRLVENSLKQMTEIISGIPASSNHDGGFLAFGPDDKLYVTTGDAGQSELAQNRESLAGKILRVNADGTIPSDNPFGNLVWSYGHRNPQGIAWDASGRLWATEHGPSGTSTGRDELNLIEKGVNYGWPIITGDEKQEGMRSPVAQSGKDETWAPGGLAYANGSLFFAGLRGQSLYQAEINGDKVELTRHFSGTYGRLRAVSAHNDYLYISTSNRDGRGSPQPNDDKIIKIDLSTFKK